MGKEQKSTKEAKQAKKHGTTDIISPLKSH